MKNPSKFFYLTVILVLLAGLVFQVTPARASTLAEIETSIDDGLAYLAGIQNVDGSWTGDFPVGITCAAVSKFQDRAYEKGFTSPFDPAYTYSDEITKAYQYIFANAHTLTPLAVQPAGDPDTNGNGYGVWFASPASAPAYSEVNYETALCLMAMHSSKLPSHPNEGGLDFNADTNPDTFAELTQEGVDFLAWSQNDSQGGWRYGFNPADSDGSVTGFATLGLAYAESFGATIPAFVKSELNRWITYAQCADGGAGYTACPGSNLYRTGHLITMMSFVGDTPATPRMDNALKYIEANWALPLPDGTGFLGTWSLMKGLSYSGVHLLDLDGDTVRDEDWYNEDPGTSYDLATYTIGVQQVDGGWGAGDFYVGSSAALKATFALLVLEKASPPPPTPAPTIGGIAPNAGPVAGGTTVIITGTNLTGGTVTFGGLAATCTVNSDTQITCTTPAHAAGPVDVVVTTPGGPATSVGGFTYMDPPTIGGIAPNSGPEAGGTSVVITGTNLTGGAFTFGGTTASCTVAPGGLSATCTTPAHLPGLVDVVVTTPGGADTETGGFTYIPAPTIGSIVPNSGPTAGGTTVVITGTNLTGGTVTFGGLPATCTVDSATQITCTSPAHAAGPVDVVVTTPGGAATSAGGFTYIPQTITSITPNFGPTGGGTAVTIVGYGFTGATSIKFGGTEGTCTVVSDTQITCVTPAHQAGPVDVVITAPLGTVTAPGGYTFVAPTFTLTASGAATVKPGDPYVYTFAYTTSAKAFNAQVVFSLPGHTTYVSNSGGYTCATSSGVVTCNLGAIDTNGSFAVTLQVDKLKKVNTPLTLQATTYVMGDNGAAVVNGSPTVSANTLTPFADVLYGNYALDYVQSVWAYGITGGCLSTNPLTYCPNRDITRAEMSVFIEKGVHGSVFMPPVVPLTYSDTSTNFAKYWIESLAADAITGGCGGTKYCPNSYITRAQMSVFLLRGKYGNTFIPAAPTGTVWLDVPVTYWAARWTERIGLDGISAGCGNGYFCPDKNVSRSEMAVLVQRTFSLPMPTP